MFLSSLTYFLSILVGKLSGWCPSGSLAPCSVTMTLHGCVTAEIPYNTAHACHVLTWSWATLCGMLVWASPWKPWLLLHRDYIAAASSVCLYEVMLRLLLRLAGSARREAVSWLPSQPWENKMSAVSIAPQVFFQPLSSCLANPACGEQYTQWDTKRQSAPRAQSVVQHYCVHFSGKMFFSCTWDFQSDHSLGDSLMVSDLLNKWMGKF